MENLHNMIIFFECMQRESNIQKLNALLSLLSKPWSGYCSCSLFMLFKKTKIYEIKGFFPQYVPWVYLKLGWKLNISSKWKVFISRIGHLKCTLVLCITCSSISSIKNAVNALTELLGQASLSELWCQVLGWRNSVQTLIQVTPLHSRSITILCTYIHISYLKSSFVLRTIFPPWPFQQRPQTHSTPRSSITCRKWAPATRTVRKASNESRALELCRFLPFTECH